MNPLEIIQNEVKSVFPNTKCEISEKPEQAIDDQYLNISLDPEHNIFVRFAPRIGYGVKLDDGQELFFMTYFSAAEGVVKIMEDTSASC